MYLPHYLASKEYSIKNVKANLNNLFPLNKIIYIATDIFPNHLILSNQFHKMIKPKIYEF